MTNEKKTENAITTLVTFAGYFALVAIWRQGWWWLLLLPMLASVLGIAKCILAACKELKEAGVFVDTKLHTNLLKIATFALAVGVCLSFWLPLPGKGFVVVAYLVFGFTIHDWWWGIHPPKNAEPDV